MGPVLWLGARTWSLPGKIGDGHLEPQEGRVPKRPPKHEDPRFWLKGQPRIQEAMACRILHVHMVFWATTKIQNDSPKHPQTAQQAIISHTYLSQVELLLLHFMLDNRKGAALRYHLSAFPCFDRGLQVCPWQLAGSMFRSCSKS